MIFPIPAGWRYEFRDDWGDPRSEGRQHRGTDIFAAEGTPVVAVEAGRAHSATEARGGNVVYLVTPSGTRYYYAHLSQQLVAGSPGERVAAGDVLGSVGNTGNAVDTPPHLHFQIATPDGETINPFLELRRAESSDRPARPTAVPSQTKKKALSWPWCSSEHSSPSSSFSPSVGSR